MAICFLATRTALSKCIPRRKSWSTTAGLTVEGIFLAGKEIKFSGCNLKLTSLFCRKKLADISGNSELTGAVVFDRSVKIAGSNLKGTYDPPSDQYRSITTLLASGEQTANSAFGASFVVTTLVRFSDQLPRDCTIGYVLGHSDKPSSHPFDELSYRLSNLALFVS